MTDQTPNPSTASFSAEPWLPQVDGFNEINDEHGHAAGDVVLAAADAAMYKVKQSPGRQPLASFV